MITRPTRSHKSRIRPCHCARSSMSHPLQPVKAIKPVQSLSEANFAQLEVFACHAFGARKMPAGTFRLAFSFTYRRLVESSLALSRYGGGRVEIHIDSLSGGHENAAVLGYNVAVFLDFQPERVIVLPAGLKGWSV